MPEYTEKRFGEPVTNEVASEVLGLLLCDDRNAVLATLARLRSGEADEETLEFVDACLEQTKGRIFHASGSTEKVRESEVKRNLKSALELRRAHIIEAAQDSALIGLSEDQVVAGLVSTLEQISNQDSPTTSLGTKMSVREVIMHIKARTPTGVKILGHNRQLLKYQRQMMMAEDITRSLKALALFAELEERLGSGLILGVHNPWKKRVMLPTFG